MIEPELPFVLRNGKEFSVPNHALTPHTMAQRELELTESGDDASIVARLYGLCDGKPTQALVKGVLAFEFGGYQCPPENRDEESHDSLESYPEYPSRELPSPPQHWQTDA